MQKPDGGTALLEKSMSCFKKVRKKVEEGNSINSKDFIIYKPSMKKASQNRYSHLIRMKMF